MQDTPPTPPATDTQDGPLPPSPPSGPVTIVIKRPPIWTMGLTILAVLAGINVMWALAEVIPNMMQGKGKGIERESWELLGLAMFLFPLAAMVVGKRYLVRLKPLKPVVFNDGSVRVPRGAESLRYIDLPYDEIMAVNEGGRPPQRHFFIESRRRVVHLPQEMFSELDGPERFFLELRRRIVSLPQGATLLEQTEAKRRAAVAAMSLQPYATHAILGIIAVFFLNTMLKGALDAPFGLLRWGANASVLVRQGEYYRLFAANFLHGNTLHVLMNGLALFYLGTLLERLLGWARFSVIYFTSCFFAMLASALSSHALMSVGASGGIFGLLGGFAVVSWRLRAQLPLGLRQTPRWWASILIINILLPLLGGVNVDYAAHIGGFFTGAIVTALFVVARATLPPPAKAFTMALAGAWIAVFAVGLGMAVASAAKTDPEREDHFAHLLLQDQSTDPQSLGNMALLWSANPHSTASQLQTAEDCVNEAIRRDPKNAEFYATLAQVAWRQKNSPLAISASQRAVTLDPDDPLLAGQMRRLLLDKGRSPQDALVPNGMTFLRAADEQHWQLHADRPAPVAGHLFVLLMHDEDEPAALVQLKLGKGAKVPLGAPEDIPTDAGLTARMGAWVSDPSAIEPGRAAWHVWRMTGHDESGS